MKKLFVLLIAFTFLLAACAAPAVETSNQNTATAPDASLATPGTGFVTVRSLQGMEALLLRSQPDPASALAGKVAPGANGKLIGINQAGTWALLQFSDQSGWAPVEALDLTIAQ